MDQKICISIARLGAVANAFRQSTFSRNLPMTSHAESRDDTRQWLLEVCQDENRCKAKDRLTACPSTQFHRHGDALNARRWLEKFWTEDVRLRFAGYPEIQGQENIIKVRS